MIGCGRCECVKESWWCECFVVSVVDVSGNDVSVMWWGRREAEEEAEEGAADTAPKTKTPHDNVGNKRLTVSGNPHLPKEDRRVIQAKLSSICEQKESQLRFQSRLKSSNLRCSCWFHIRGKKTKVETLISRENSAFDELSARRTKLRTYVFCVNLQKIDLDPFEGIVHQFSGK